eukprot:2986087-Prymnesium_polylepis.1
MPGDLASPVVSLKPTGASKAMRRRPLPRGGARAQTAPGPPQPEPLPRDAPQPGPARGIPIADLFLSGVYE